MSLERELGLWSFGEGAWSRQHPPADLPRLQILRSLNRRWIAWWTYDPHRTDNPLWHLQWETAEEAMAAIDAYIREHP